MAIDYFSVEGARPVGAGLLSPAGSLRDVELAKRIAGYKRMIAGRYTSISPDEISVLPHGPLWVSPKIDGHFWVLVVEDGDAILVAPNGKVLSGALPLLVEVRKTVGKRAVGRTIVPGELFALRREGRPRSGDVANTLGAGEASDAARLGFFAFDLMEGGDERDPKVAAEYPPRVPVLERLFEGGQRVRAIKTDRVESHDDVETRFAEWVREGKGEGLVLRALDGRIFKLKPFFTLDAAVIGFTEQTDARDHVRSLLLAVMRENGQYQLVGSCGNIGSDKLRGELYQRLKGTIVDSTYRFASSTGALFRFVEPKLVVEVKVTDLGIEDSEGRPVRRMVLEYGANGWTPLQLKAGASMIHPIFQRVRDDKEINPVDIRAAQVLERVQIEELDQAVAKIERPRSQVVRREVFVKTTKGQRAVRKLVVWQTHKERDGAFPAFVVHWTDYSPGRQEPLQREVRLAPDAETAAEIAEAMVADGVKKGWERVA
jgi:hypothetical protein